MIAPEAIWTAARKRSAMHAVAAIGAVAVSMTFVWIVTRIVELQKPTDVVILYVFSTIFMFVVTLVHVFLAVGFGIKVAILRLGDADTVTLETRNYGSKEQALARLKIFAPFLKLKLTAGESSYNISAVRDGAEWWFLVSETEVLRNN